MSRKAKQSPKRVQRRDEERIAWPCGADEGMSLIVAVQKPDFRGKEI